MKLLRVTTLLIILLSVVSTICGQEAVVQSRQTPEQEAVKQTEKLQIELGLNPEQTKQIYEINLYYARQRQVSNTRSQAMERVKNKDADIQRILNEEQIARLKNKRYERSSIDIPSVNRSQPINATGFRSSSQNRVVPAARVVSDDVNDRNSSRSPNTKVQATSVLPQTVKRNTTTNRTTQTNTTQSTLRPQVSAPVRTRTTGTTNRR